MLDPQQRTSNCAHAVSPAVWVAQRFRALRLFWPATTRTLRLYLHFLHQQYFFSIIDLSKLYLDDLVVSRLYHAANERRLNRQFAMSAVDQHAQLHTFRTSMAKQAIHGA